VSILVVDVGTSGVRAAVVTPSSEVTGVAYERVLPATPMPGLVELDARELARAVLEVANRALEEAGAVEAVGIANQRATTIVWERSSGEPVAPGIGWQDLRTVGTCLALQAEGFRLAPNASATKLASMLDAVDPDRERDLCFGTVDTWVAWVLSGGSLHVTDATNAGVTGLRDQQGSAWDERVLEALRIPRSMLPTVVDSSGVVGEASALSGAPPIAGIAGDQQASLVGQGCLRPGLAKATFGTGGMLDCCMGARPPGFSPRGPQGTFPIVAWQRSGRLTWGVEALMLSAGSCVEWLRDDLGVISEAAESDSLAASAEGTGDVWFVPALLGMGTPVWDFGARGTLIGMTRGTTRAQVVRAVLEGVAHRGADLLEAAEADSGLEIPSLRVDGGMSANDTFASALAEAIGRPVELSPVTEATTLGAAYLAGLAVGTWASEEDVMAAFRPRRVVEPALGDSERQALRARWLEAREKALRTVPELSELDF